MTHLFAPAGLVCAVAMTAAIQPAAPPQSPHTPPPATAMGMAAPPPAPTSNQDYSSWCYQFLTQNYDASTGQWFASLLRQGGEATAACESIYDFMELRKIETQQLTSPQVLASTYWNLRVAKWDRTNAHVEAHRAWRGAIIQQNLGAGPAAIYDRFSRTAGSPEASFDVYYKVFAYANGWAVAYPFGAELKRHVASGGSARDAAAQAIRQRARQALDVMVAQGIPWAQRIRGAVEQGFADGLYAGRVEGGMLRQPGAADFNREMAAACNPGDRSVPNFDDLRCAEIDYGPGMLRR